jgi:cytochrome c-type biogenesis protein CcmE
MTNATLGKILLTAVVGLGGGGFVVYSTMGSSEHYRQVHELVADGYDQWKDAELKVQGKVGPGSLVEAVADQQVRRTFLLEMGGKKIRVFSAGPKPDTFKDDPPSDVVATGHLVPAKEMQQVADLICAKAPKGCPVRADAEQAFVLDASDLMAKCPSKYANGGSATIDPKYR